jgi:beta-lactamase class A
MRFFPFLIAGLCVINAAPESPEQAFARLTTNFDGRVGVCAIEKSAESCVNGDRRFSLQSVMKLLVGIAAADALQLSEPVTLRKEDLSLFVQPIANIVNARGSFHTTLGDLVRRAIVDSDSAATDNLIRRLGGPAVVQAFLNRKGIAGIRIDRDEKTLQTEIVGLAWKPEFVDAALLDSAIKRVPREVRDEADRRYRNDVRDTATPKGMAKMLDALNSGKLLSPDSTRYILDVMSQTVTFPDRLKAGLLPGWKIAHKTGTSGTWNAVTVATNDVGILTAPDGSSIAIAVFIGDSRAPDAARAALTAKLATAAISHHRLP